MRALKGEGRPVNEEGDRAVVVAALEAVSGVCVFKEVTAMRFLSIDLNLLRSTPIFAISQ